MLAFARYPLTIREMTDVLRIGTSGKPWMKNNSIYWNTLLRACPSFVSVSSGYAKGRKT